MPFVSSAADTALADTFAAALASAEVDVDELTGPHRPRLLVVQDITCGRELARTPPRRDGASRPRQSRVCCLLGLVCGLV
jgi:hypothetical protein